MFNWLKQSFGCSFFSTVPAPRIPFADILQMDPSMIAIQVMSDLHLEFPHVLENFPAMQPHAPILALCGDIGKTNVPAYRTFLEILSPKFQLILVIAGNHEYYGLEYHSAQQELHRLCSSFSNVLFMQERAIIVNERWRIVGTTLWSYVPDERKQEVSRSLNDYHLITIKDTPDSPARKITVDDTVKWFRSELNFIQSQIEKAKSKTPNDKVVILTHHTPSMQGTSDPIYDNHPINCAFSTDLKSMMGSPIVSWFFGHTHYSSEQWVNGTQLLSNQMGYLHEKSKQGFSPNLVVAPGYPSFIPPSPLPPMTITWREADD